MTKLALSHYRRLFARSRASATGQATHLDFLWRPVDCTVMRAIVLALLVVSLALPLGSGASGGSAASGDRAAVGAAAKITLRGRQGGAGPWRSSLSLKLVKVKLTSFVVCAVWDQAMPPPTCHAAPGDRLPKGTSLRLEQRPAGSGVKRADSPGWGMIGLSQDAALEAVLSNNISQNQFGTISYRVTLRSASGRIQATSNTFRVVWHR